MKTTTALGEKAARALAELAEVSLPESSDEGLQRVRRALGVRSSLQAVCDFYAAPFIHGPALEPEINRLQVTIDDSPAEGKLLKAREQLQNMQLELSSATSYLDVISEESLPRKLCSSALATVQERLEAEPARRAAMQREISEYRARLEAERPQLIAPPPAQCPPDGEAADGGDRGDVDVQSAETQSAHP